MKRKLILVAASLMAFAGAGSASAKTDTTDSDQAISISTIDLHGAGFDATISYDSAWSSAFGTPTLNGNSLTFGSGSGWFSASVPGSEITISPSFSVVISATNGNSLDSVLMGASGSYSLSGANTEVFGKIAWDFDQDAIANPGGNISVGATTQSAKDSASGLWSQSANWTLLNSKSVAFTITPELTAFANGNNRTASLGLSELTFGVSVAPVPEPEAYLMMLAGLGIIGGVARRRSAGR
ncbi:PEP-CTERM sorting domain-containing protein [Aromatoleum diolicum]|uniref:PEP-CTERM sorting domain-containing protein n=1 Tax=Aromatoleum diolicum TaxID=75796 RepID=A0ABX1QE07_9RHOO|nr:PEP-CTERM sorting domain-containing protein [Aromatoleum diolicum]NMG76654.1 PEP-CTERM sorting domain-containing protein [Aromatoleum diolicum]